MAEAARKRMTVGDFLSRDDWTDTRYELVRGEIVAMAPALEDHGDLISRIVAQFVTKLSPPCRAISQGGISLPDRDDTFYVADLAVTCGPRSKDRFILEPRIIIEVLSPSTRSADHGIKLSDYRTIASVQEIAIFRTDVKRVDVWHRETSGWHVDDLTSGGRVVFSSVGVEFDLDAVYSDILD